MIPLLLMAAYGVILGFLYQCFLACIAKLRTVVGAVFFYIFAALFCFLLTALLLFFVNGGRWGVYGFLSIAAGFFVYYRLLWRQGKKPAIQGIAALASCRRGVRFYGSKILSMATFPFGKVVDKGDALWEKAEERWKKRKPPVEEEREAEDDGSALS